MVRAMYHYQYSVLIQYLFIILLHRRGQNAARASGARSYQCCMRGGAGAHGGAPARRCCRAYRIDIIAGMGFAAAAV